MKVDYLICGAGATGMSFLDVILSETDANVAIVDRRDAPGGHWNDAYPYVRLHQSGSFYGVCSRVLNRARVPGESFDTGTFELSTKSEILHYYHDLMENTYLPSGRVTFLPMSEHLGEGKVCSLLSGEVTQFEVAKKTVNAGRVSDVTSIPSLHKRPFGVAEGVSCIAPNDLPNKAAGHDGFTVIGAGKTAMDAVVWLLGRGVDPDKVTWVKPNDYWLFNRERILNHPDFFMSSMAAFQGEFEALSTATSVQEYCEKMEENGIWHRIDKNVWPTKFHAAVCSGAEMTAMRAVKDVVRAGHVTRIEPDRLILENASVETGQGQLYVDCTARGGAIVGADAPPIFDGDEINLFMVRQFQPVFSAALIAFLEAKVPDAATRKACTRMVDFHDTPVQYIAQMFQGICNQGAWSQVPEVKAWLDTCRLYAINHLLVGLGPDDTEKLQMLSRFKPLTQAAAENIPKLLAAEQAR